MHKTYNQTHEKRLRNIGVNTQKNITQTIGELLKNERENKNLSLTAISNQLNVPYKKLLKTEQGLGKIHYFVIGLLLKYHRKKLEIKLVDK